MVLETTYTNPEYDQLINDLVGKSFSLLQMIKMKGAGSKRFIIDSVSQNMSSLLNTVDDINYANIELRPGGILVRINKGLRTFSWAIPFYHLVVYKTDGLSIHAQGKFIRFRNDKFLKENKKFIDKMLDAKVKHELLYAFP